jgi:hypothetical protein
MDQSIQLANYATTAAVHVTLSGVICYTLFLSEQAREELSFYAWWALFGVMLDTFSWGIHQSWFGYRWYLLMADDPGTVWFRDNSWLLTPNYFLGWIGVAVTTTAFLRGRFVHSLALKATLISGWWVFVWHMGSSV